MSYDKLYLEPNMDLHRLLFIKLAENKEYSFCSLVDSYMTTSEIRAKQDQGNWSALNKGYKQLLNSIDYSVCEVYDGKIVDDIVIHWMADIYVLFQWMYDISSRELAHKISAKELMEKYNPLHELSEKNACVKLHELYFQIGI